ncbi:MAG TPA: hypothetical protein VKZ60_02860 [Chloroflexota bacterium]|jgi:hypothetical protein|nr:hypothetical protein [Chloroflexota bacterium]
MREGLLWYDATPKGSIQHKIDAAAARFAARTGRQPNCCHVHPSQQVEHPRLRVVPDPRLQPHYFWVGIDETLLPAARRPRRGDAA